MKLSSQFIARYNSNLKIELSEKIFLKKKNLPILLILKKKKHLF